MTGRYQTRARVAAAGAPPPPPPPPPKKNIPVSKSGGVSRQRKTCWHCGKVSSLEHRKKDLPERNQCEHCGKLRDHPGKEKGGRDGLTGYAYRKGKDGKKDSNNKKNTK